MLVLSSLFFAGMLLPLAPVHLLLSVCWIAAARKWLPFVEHSMCLRLAGLTLISLFLPPVVWGVWGTVAGESPMSRLDRPMYLFYLLPCMGWLVLPRVMVGSLRKSFVALAG